MNRPRLHFVHANGVPTACYRRLLSILSGRFRITAPRRLAHTAAYPVDEGWHGLTTEVLDGIAADGPEPPIAVGHSLGAVLLLRAATRQPRCFRALILIDPPALLGPRAWLLAAAKHAGLADRLTPAGRSRGRRSRWPSVASAVDQLAGRRLFAGMDREAVIDYVLGATRPLADGGVELAFRREVETKIFRHLPVDLGREPPLRDVRGALIRLAASDVAHPRSYDRLARRHGLQQVTLPGDHLAPLARPADVAAGLIPLIDHLSAAPVTARTGMTAGAAGGGAAPDP